MRTRTQPPALQTRHIPPDRRSCDYRVSPSSRTPGFLLCVACTSWPLRPAGKTSARISEPVCSMARGRDGGFESNAHQLYPQSALGPNVTDLPGHLRLCESRTQKRRAPGSAPWGSFGIACPIRAFPFLFARALPPSIFIYVHPQASDAASPM